MKLLFESRQCLISVGKRWRSTHYYLRITSPLLTMAVIRWDIVREACFDNLLGRWNI